MKKFTKSAVWKKPAVPFTKVSAASLNSFDFTVGGRLGWPGCGPFANGDDDDIDDAKYKHDEGRYDGEV